MFTDKKLREQVAKILEEQNKIKGMLFELTADLNKYKEDLDQAGIVDYANKQLCFNENYNRLNTMANELKGIVCMARATLSKIVKSQETPANLNPKRGRPKKNESRI